VDLAGRRATNDLLLEAVALLGQRVGGREDGRRVGGAIGNKALFVFLLAASSAVGRTGGHGSALGNTRIEVRSGATMWKIVSKERTFGGGEHHTNGTRVDEEDRVPTNALARGLRRAEQQGR
jgi:hypothetical protein